jgi:hypothetical protein
MRRLVPKGKVGVQDEGPRLVGVPGMRHEVGRERVEGPARPIDGLPDAVQDLDA